MKLGKTLTTLALGGLLSSGCASNNISSKPVISDGVYTVPFVGKIDSNKPRVVYKSDKPMDCDNVKRILTVNGLDSTLDCNNNIEFAEKKIKAEMLYENDLKNAQNSIDSYNPLIVEAKKSSDFMDVVYLLYDRFGVESDFMWKYEFMYDWEVKITSARLERVPEKDSSNRQR